MYSNSINMTSLLEFSDHSDLDDYVDTQTHEVGKLRYLYLLNKGSNSDLLQKESFDLEPTILVKPLSSFGAFETGSESDEPGWIRDHTSGEVHEDMPTIAFLYSQSLTLPAAAKEFISQSPKLTEEADWERRKAAFYSFYAQDIQDRAFQALSGLSKLEALRLIAKKTSHFEHEVILGPYEGSECSPLDEKWLEKDLERLAAASSKIIPSLVAQLTERENKLKRSYNSYGAFSLCTSNSQILKYSGDWKEDVVTLNQLLTQVVDHHIRLFQFQHAKPRFEPRTGWVHVKTHLLGPDVDFDSGVPPEILKNPLLDQILLCEGQEKINKNTRAQIDRFLSGWRSLSTDMVENYDSFFNDDKYRAFDFRFPYNDVSPRYCKDVLQHHLDSLKNEVKPSLSSRPTIQMWKKLHHEVVVYLDLKGNDWPKTKSELSDYVSRCVITNEITSTLTPKDHLEFCSNCFSKAHLRIKCSNKLCGYAQ